MTTLKLNYEGELRRIPIATTLTFQMLEAQTKELFPSLREFPSLQFTWVDDENDCVNICLH